MDLPANFEVNTVSPFVRNVYFDEDKVERELDSLLVLDAEKDIEIVEENLFVTITAFCTTWLQKAFSKKVDKRVDTLRQVITDVLDSDACNKDLLDFTETYTDITTKTISNHGETTVMEVRRKSRTRIHKGYRSLFAGRLANEGKLKFGNLHYNEANFIMVRRWLSNILSGDEYKDLRIVDKNLALDRATFMVFVVSEDFKRFQVCFEEGRMQDRLLMRFGASA